MKGSSWEKQLMYSGKSAESLDYSLKHGECKKQEKQKKNKKKKKEEFRQTLPELP
jgi:hypothetical protein